jgi:hypothetical protein
MSEFGRQQRPTPEAGPRYKEAQGYIGTLQNAKKLVNDVNARKGAAKEELGKILEEEPASDSSRFNLANVLSFMPGLLSTLARPPVKRALMWTARLVLLALIIWQFRVLHRELWADEQVPENMPDVLIQIDANAPDFEGVKNYARYIAGKVAAGGIDAIEGKWVEGIPPSFKPEAQAALALVGQDFEIDRVSADKSVIYNVECHPLSNPGKLVSFEIVRRRLAESGKVIYRLQRIY